MTTRRTFLKTIAGAVISVVLAKQSGAVLPAKAEEPIPSVEEFTWVEDPFPPRFRYPHFCEVEDAETPPEYVEVYPYQESCPGGPGATYWPNPKYRDAPLELKLGYRKGEDGKMEMQGVMVRREKIEFEEVPAGELPDFRFER